MTRPHPPEWLRILDARRAPALFAPTAVFETGPDGEVDTVCWVDQFDFPMIHNTRLTSGERCAVSLIALTPNVCQSP